MPHTLNGWTELTQLITEAVTRKSLFHCITLDRLKEIYYTLLLLKRFHFFMIPFFLVIDSNGIEKVFINEINWLNALTLSHTTYNRPGAWYIDESSQLTKLLHCFPFKQLTIWDSPSIFLHLLLLLSINL